MKVSIKVLFFILLSFTRIGLFASTYGGITDTNSKGSISGKVIDEKTGEELIGVIIHIEGTALGAVTDYEGKYIITQLKPDTYNLTATCLNYSKKIIVGVEVKPQETINLDILMGTATSNLNEVQITAEYKKESTSALLLQQKTAFSISSGVDANLTKKTPDRTTADMIKRISGASIQDNKFAIIRGLNDRYNMGFLNGAPLPSTESDRKAFSLDIIPASVIDNIQIIKGATPNMPGDFGGGIIMINTKDIPDENKITINFGSQVHSITTFKEGIKGYRSSNDWLGFDGGTRSISSDVPSIEESRNASLEQKAGYTRSFNNNFSPITIHSLRPSYSFQLSASKRLKLFKNDFGVVFAWNYNNSVRKTPFVTTSPVIGVGQESVDKDKTDGSFYSYDRYRNTVMNGGVLNMTYKIGSNTKISFKNLFTLNGDDQTIHQTGNLYANNRQDNTKYDNYIYYYQHSRMYSSQFSIDHSLFKNKLKLKYTGSLNSIQREMPDYRRILYQSQYKKSNGDTTYGPYVVSIVPNAKSYTPLGSGRYFSSLNELMYSNAIDLSVPVKLPLICKTELKAGGFYQSRSREFQARNFIYSQDDNNYDPSKGDPLKLLGPNDVFADNNISASTHYLTETTQGSDQYNASSKLGAAYAMLDMRPIEKLRIIVGVRVEHFNQQVGSINLGAQQKVDTTNTDWLPSLNIVYELNDKINIRASAAKTLSRPEFREFAQLAFYEINYNAIITGNPNLVRSQIYNYDFKCEYFPTSSQLLSINPFYKKFINPVEAISLPGASGIYQFSYMNALTAQCYGTEFEARLNFATMKKLKNAMILKNITLFVNYSIIGSSVTLSDTISTKEASDKRPLQGQSNYVFNSGILYSNIEKKFDVSLTANRIGRRIIFVSPSKRSIIWEAPRTVIDLSISKVFFKKLQAKLTLGDILAKPLTFYNDLNLDGKFNKNQDPIISGYSNGFSVQLSAGYTF